MKSKDALISELELPDTRLSKRWIERVTIGVMDKRNWPEQKNEYACSKRLSEAIPNSILSGCEFEKGSNPTKTFANICDGMKSVLDWAFTDCHIQGIGNKR